MPAEIVGEVLGGALKFIGRILFEVVFELAIRGMGYLLCRPFNERVNPEGGLVAVVGISFWATVGAGVYFAFR